jgi:predicted nucleic acid-binding protein
VRFLLDTSVYLEVLLDAAVEERLREPLQEIAPDLFLSSVVRAELTQGARGRAGRALVDRLARPFERIGRVVAPDHGDWVRASTIQSRIWDAHPGLRTKRLLHDLLIACTAHKIGATLVTENERDFAVIDRWLRTRRMRLEQLASAP